MAGFMLQPMQRMNDMCGSMYEIWGSEWNGFEHEPETGKVVH